MAYEGPDCEAICLSNATVLLDNSEVLPVTNWLDEDGDECAPEVAASCVAGPDTEGFWYAITISLFEHSTTH